MNRGLKRGLSRRQLFGASHSPVIANGASGSSAAAKALAVFSSNCIEPKGVSCRLCGEACDKDAIRFQPQVGGGTRIRLEETCDGCGQCVSACPVSAISVTTVEVAA